MVRVSLRTVVMDVPTQDVITQDNVSIKVNAVVYFRVIEPQKAIIGVENFLMATSQLSQTTLRSVLGQSELDDLLSQREKINHKLQQIIDSNTEPWGVKVSNVEVKVIAAEGEFQASQRLADAAKILADQPSALTLRYLQTLREIATENNSTTIFPVPIDLLKPFLNSGGSKTES
jgi:regulator of protease activity HflC (stomatin/prohibitin superfamily)